MKREEAILNITSFVLIGATIIKAIESGETLSRLVQSGAEPLFIIATIVTTLSLWQYRSWRFTAITLSLLTAFSVARFPNIHAAFAILFFASSAFVIARDKRLNRMALLFIGAVAVIPFSLMWFEVGAISIILAFHFTYLWWNSAALRRHLF
jgi:hypothetical protein